MKKITLLLASLVAFAGFAQDNLTLYNLRSVHQSHSFANPAFRPDCKINIGLPIPSQRFSVGNSFAFKDLFVPTSDDSLQLDVPNVIGKLKDRNYMRLSVHNDILNFGFRLKDKFYVSFDVGNRFDAILTYPKDLVVLAFEGNGQSLLGQRASFDDMGINVNAYREHAIGVQYEYNDKWSFGVRPKYLYGYSNVTTEESQFGLTTGDTNYALTIDGQFDVRTSILDSNQQDDIAAQMFGLGNNGFSIDLGATHQFTDEIQFSASLLDLGFIRWKNNPQNYTKDETEIQFTGVGVGTILGSDTNPTSGFEDLVDSLENELSVDENQDPYTTFLTARLNLGANYQLAEQHSVSALSQSQIYKGKIRSSLALGYNFRARKWFEWHINYSIYNRSFLNVGTGVSLRGGPIRLYLATDNVLAFIPNVRTGAKNASAQIGMNICIGCRSKDSDKDGIPDKKDDCPKVKGLKQFNGCPDTDGDLLIDKIDSCPTDKGPKELQGCPDSDGDGVIDKKDDCPDVAGLAFFDGCPDTDNDSIINKLDSCPEVAGVPVCNGCPDADGDKIRDRDDECPNVAGPEAYNGCPDTDGDGLLDKEDACPTEPGSKENNGCPVNDRDGDGLEDKDDACPDVVGPAENKGCPYADTDGDGVIDKDDRCPQTPGVESNAGCPEIEEEEQEVLDLAFRNLEFETGKTVIKSSSFESLDNLSTIMKKKEAYKLRIAGHTDAVGAAASNLRLSEGRAKSVAKYLTNKGVKAEQLITEWYGETKPVATNDTPEGRQTNRRVEMEVVFD